MDIQRIMNSSRNADHVDDTLESHSTSTEQHIQNGSARRIGQLGRPAAAKSSDQPPIIRNIAESLGLDKDTPIFICNLPFRHRYESLEDGAFAFYDPIRKPVPYDDTLQEVEDNVAAHVEQTYNAIITTSAEMTQAQQEMIEDFMKTLNAVEDRAFLLVQVSHSVVKCVVQLGEIGDHLRPDQIDKLGPTTQDKYMTASQRIERLCELFKNNKRVCEELLEGKDSITKIVAAPNATEMRITGEREITSAVAMNVAPVQKPRQKSYDQVAAKFTHSPHATLASNPHIHFSGEITMPEVPSHSGPPFGSAQPLNGHQIRPMLGSPFMFTCAGPAPTGIIFEEDRNEEEEDSCDADDEDMEGSEDGEV